MSYHLHTQVPDVMAIAAEIDKLDDTSTPPSPASPAIDDGAGNHLQQIATGHRGHEPFDNVSLARTKSIAEQLSLPHEIAFVALVCMSQFFTRKLCEGCSSNHVQDKAHDSYRSIIRPRNLNHQRHWAELRHHPPWRVGLDFGRVLAHRGNIHLD